MTLRFGILTVSDRSSRGERPDASGPALQNQVADQGWNVARVDIVPDDFRILQDTLARWADSGDLDVILTSGGTGFSPRDITPEATQTVVERPAPGLAEAMRTASLKVTPHAMLSRAAAGIRGRTLIINLPGSPKAAVENLDAVISVLSHAVQLLQDDTRAEAGHQFGGG
ncbi:MAG: MogA/MoaB family molybdenum cofactor biosynthesis protein [Chloroflexota bacterium]